VGQPWLARGLAGELPMPVRTAGELLVFRLPGRDPVHVGLARRQVRRLLGAGGGEAAELGELIVSELVTNAICHGEGPIGLRLLVTGGQLRVEVHDDGAGRPVRRQVGADAECGRGLELLDGLAGLHGGELGVLDDPADPGKTVFVTLTLEASALSGEQPHEAPEPGEP
jgi:Histidine kinase-like ATPase domain